MKRALLACGSALALMSAAAAADIPRYPPPVTKAPGHPGFYNWTGFYLGINGGGGWGTSAWDSTGDFNLSGGLIGGTIGYNWQGGGFIFGLEGDLDWSNIKGTTAAFCPLGCETSNSWLATVRGRLGLAIDRLLPYLTGGLAAGDIRARTPFLPGGTETNVGWTLGGGLELALMGNWTAKAEYLYVDLGEFNCGLACGVSVIDNVSFSSHVLRGGLNYRF